MQVLAHKVPHQPAPNSSLMISAIPPDKIAAVMTLNGIYRKVDWIAVESGLEAPHQTARTQASEIAPTWDGCV